MGDECELNLSSWKPALERRQELKAKEEIKETVQSKLNIVYFWAWDASSFALLTPLKTAKEE